MYPVEAQLARWRSLYMRLCDAHNRMRLAKAELSRDPREIAEMECEVSRLMRDSEAALESSRMALEAAKAGSGRA